VRSTQFFESIAYRDHLLAQSADWSTPGKYDWVGMISYKSAMIKTQGAWAVHTAFHGEMIPEIVARSAKEGHDFVPLLRSPLELVPQASFDHSVQFQVAWDTLLKALGYSEEQLRACDKANSFFRSAFVARPQITLQLSKFMDRAISVAESDPVVAGELAKECRCITHHGDDIPRRIWNTTYWQFHPFVFERLIVFYACAEKLNACWGTETVCNNFYCG
jgi:hypothetical protein